MGKNAVLPRISALRERMLVQPSVCIERAYYRTLSYRETPHLPSVLRRARAFEKILHNMTVNITPGELIVGQITSKPRGGSISPEVRADWILNELDLLTSRDIDPFQPLTESEKQTLREIVPDWIDSCLHSVWSQRLPADSVKYDDTVCGGGAYCENNQYYGHISPDYSLILELGTEGLLARAEQRLKKLGESPETLPQRQELEAMCICLHALEAFAERYAERAEELAEAELNAVRHAELRTIAANCRRVPRKPASTFHQALQAVWFTYIGLAVENWGTGNTFLRADQYLFPYYHRDMDTGLLTRDAALELVALLLIKCNEFCVVYSESKSHGFAGNTSGTSFTLGGVTPQGESAVNALSYLFLEAEQLVNLNSEDMVVRITQDTPDDFLLLACTVARDASGKLKFIGDKTAVRQLLCDGRTQEMANDYAVVGCTSPTVPGRSLDVPGGIISLPMMLELALNNGVSRMTGLRLGVPTGDPHDFQTYGQLWEAFCAQVRAVLPHCHVIKNLDKEVFAELAPSPFLSALYPVCMERGQDVIRGGTLPQLTFAMALAGAPNVGDSLAALKKLVYEERRLTMDQVLTALNNNFRDAEDIQALLATTPKFGNNDPYVDRIVDQVLSYASDVLAETPGYAGGITTAAAAAVTANVGLGMCLGATPDGRFAGTPISEGGISPYQGRNTSGPTATLMSVAHLDHMKLRHGSVLNMRFDPKALGSEEKLRKFAAMIRAYVAAGGFLVQFNIVDTATLREAQLHPERHRDLVVRVATYAAYFTELGSELQNDIINRLEFGAI